MNSVIPIKQLNYKDVLSEHELAEIEHECQQYEHRPAAAIDALQVVQQQRGWINDECLYAIADCLQMSATELEGVATFYNHIYRHPVGEHVIHLCNSISCWLHDYQQIAECLKSELNIEFGQTSEDGKFTLLPNVCLGCCDKAPALMVDGQLVENLNEASTRALIARLRSSDG